MTSSREGRRDDLQGDNSVIAIGGPRIGTSPKPPVVSKKRSRRRQPPVNDMPTTDLGFKSNR